MPVTWGAAALTALALLAAYVEEVRIGFEHWGEAVVAELEEDGLYKVSPGFLVAKHGDHSHMYLAMPDATASVEGFRDHAMVAEGDPADAKIPPAFLSDKEMEHGEYMLASSTFLVSIQSSIYGSNWMPEQNFSVVYSKGTLSRVMASKFFRMKKE